MKTHRTGSNKIDVTVNYDPDQPRDDHGMWSGGSASYDAKASTADEASQKAGSMIGKGSGSHHEHAAQMHMKAAKAARGAAKYAPTAQDKTDMENVAREHEKKAKFHTQKAAPKAAPQNAPKMGEGITSVAGAQAEDAAHAQKRAAGQKQLASEQDRIMQKSGGLTGKPASTGEKNLGKNYAKTVSKVPTDKLKKLHDSAPASGGKVAGMMKQAIGAELKKRAKKQAKS